MADDEQETPCPGCGKPTFPSQRPMLCLGTKWHPGCIKCTTCGVTLTPRMMETYEKKPYCRAHRPNATATATTVKNDFKTNTATTAPKAARRQPGVDVTARQTFYVGANTSLDELGKKMHQDKTSINPRGYIPDQPAVPNRARAQGVNKLEGTTFNENSMTNKASSAPMHSENDWSHNAPAPSYDEGGHDQGHHDQGGYEEGGGYDQGNQDQGGYDQGHQEHGGYEEGGYADQGNEGGGYQEEGGAAEYAEEGAYQEGGAEYAEEGAYQEGGYEEGQQW